MIRVNTRWISLVNNTSFHLNLQIVTAQPVPKKNWAHRNHVSGEGGWSDRAESVQLVGLVQNFRFYLGSRAGPACQDGTPG